MDDFERLFQEAIKDPEFCAEYEALAQRIGIQRSNLSRLESGNYNPSLAFLKKVAKGMGKKLTLTFQ